MQRPDTQSQHQRRAVDSRKPWTEPPPTPAPPRHDRFAREGKEPADMRLEPQPEEPGYGHGV